MLPKAPILRETEVAVALADLAVRALVEEACLTPKPGLVDLRGPGSHFDLSLPLMCRSAESLRPFLVMIAARSINQRPDAELRRVLGEIGRQGEGAMYKATRGVNSHRGAIWTLGLLTAGAAMSLSGNPAEIAWNAAALARLPDAGAAPHRSRGTLACLQFGVSGARGEAIAGFPHVTRAGLPALWAARERGASTAEAQLDALLAIMAELDDTCILQRGGWLALRDTQEGARQVILQGGTSTACGRVALRQLEETVRCHWVSPGGSADLLAATLFIDKCSRWDYDSIGAIWRD